MDQGDLDHQLASIAALGEPVRRGLYLYVAAQPGSVTRDEAARAIGVSPGVAGFHLNRLLREGLLVASYRRLSSRSGPGAGRPSKLYRRSRRQFRVILPPRNYEFLALLFAQALQTSGPASRDALARVAYEAGRRLGIEAQQAGPHPDSDGFISALWAKLVACGYQPFRRTDDELRLRNCPYQALVSEHRELVCPTNVSFLEGLVAGLGVSAVQVTYDPQPDICCVMLRWASSVESGEQAKSVS